jgi:hypothetical protein
VSTTNTKTTLPLKTSLPEDLCEWCGQPIKYVRLLPADKLTIKIDADPLLADGLDYGVKGKPLLGVYRRARPEDVPYRVDGVYLIIEGDGWREKIQYSYSNHKQTCPNADMWATGHARSEKKRGPNVPKKPLIQADDVRVDPEEQARADERVRLARSIFQADEIGP